MSLCSIVKVDVSAIAAADLPRRPRARRACRARCSSPPTSATTRPSSAAATSASRTSRASASPSRGPFRHRGVATAGLGSLRPLGRADRRRRLLRGPRADHRLRRRPVAEAAALRQLRLLRAAAHRRLGARGAEPARRPHRPPLGDGDGDLRDPGRAGRARRARACAAPACARCSPAARCPRSARRCSRSACSRSPTRCSTRRWPRCSTRCPFTDEIQAALLRREGPKGELLAAVVAYERGEFPTLAAGDAAPSLAGAYRAALEWADEAGRAVARATARLTASARS